MANTYSLSLLQGLESLWTQAGGSAASAPEAAAIAAAESGGNSTQVNPNDPNGGSFGLWQINGIHSSDQTETANPNWQTNPLSNAKAAVALWSANGGGTVGFTQPWAAELGGTQPIATANFQSALATLNGGNTWNNAQDASGVGTPTVLPPWLAAIAPAAEGAAEANVGGSQPGGLTTGTPSLAQQGATAAANAAAAQTAALGNIIAGPLGTLQTSWAAFWAAHPAWVILAGIVLALMAWSLMNGGSTTTVEAPAKPVPVPA